MTAGVAAAGQRPAEKHFALGRAVDVRRVEEGDAGIERRVDDARAVASPMRMPKLLQPRPTSETSSEPILRVSTGRDVAAGRSTVGASGRAADGTVTQARLA